MAEWDPENESDPDKLQREFLAMGKDLLSQIKANCKREKLEEGLLKEDLLEVCAVPAPVMIGAYRAPTLEEASLRVKKAWEETKKIAPDASDSIQVEILRTLLMSSWSG